MLNSSFVDELLLSVLELLELDFVEIDVLDDVLLASLVLEEELEVRLLLEFELSDFEVGEYPLVELGEDLVLLEPVEAVDAVDVDELELVLRSRNVLEDELELPVLLLSVLAVLRLDVLLLRVLTDDLSRGALELLVLLTLVTLLVEFTISVESLLSELCVENVEAELCDLDVCELELVLLNSIVLLDVEEVELLSLTCENDVELLSLTVEEDRPERDEEDVEDDEFVDSLVLE